MCQRVATFVPCKHNPASMKLCHAACVPVRLCVCVCVCPNRHQVGVCRQCSAQLPQPTSSTGFFRSVSASVLGHEAPALQPTRLCSSPRDIVEVPSRLQHMHSKQVQRHTHEEGLLWLGKVLNMPSITCARAAGNTWRLQNSSTLTEKN